MLLAVLAGGTPVAAQTAAPVPASTAPRPGVRLFSDSVFHMGIAHLASPSEAFVWEGNFGGRIDFLDWGRGRGTFVANYQVVMGEEFKAFDPNQGNYTLELSGSTRFGGNELAGVFHHESRHLSDRFKMLPVDWNMVGARLTRTATAGALSFEAEGQALKVVQRSLVDYEWEVDGRFRSDVVLRPGIGVLMNLDLRVLGVDGTRDRATQTGVRAESGVRFDGEKGALELFFAGERRIDPLLFQAGTMNLAMVGFRLLSR